jgi:hypothetical protein
MRNERKIKKQILNINIKIKAEIFEIKTIDNNLKSHNIIRERRKLKR